jgi:hypothetical protein
MGYQTKIQLIKRKDTEQWYINFPSALAQAVEFQRGEIVEWLVQDRFNLVMRRSDPPRTAPVRTPRTETGAKAPGPVRRTLPPAGTGTGEAG